MFYNVIDKEVVMTGEEKGSEHRTTERMDLALQISTPDQEGKTINISASGVYFEIVTSDMNAFSPSITIPIKIDAVTNTPGCNVRNIKLHGQGVIVWNEIKDVTSQGNRLGVALEFKDRLNILMD
jgi:hypothetical protein